MPDKGTKKKIIQVDGGEAPATAKETRTFVPSGENKAKAGTSRLIAIISWIVAIGFEIGAILLLRSKPQVKMALLIALIAADLIFAVIGNLLWKSANRLSPASEKEPVRFFIQNQLGVIISVIAFLPLVLLIFTNKDLNGKQKGLVGAIAVIALLIAGATGINLNPPSQEKYAAQEAQAESLKQTAQVQSLTGADHVFWTKSGTRYHLYSDCYHINTNKTDEIFSGTVAQAKALKNITELCSTCKARAEKEKASPAETNTPAETPKE